MKIALVLGAGGPVGHGFHAGVLRALAEVCGWDAREADLIVGTSAGAHAGALLRAGLSAHELFTRVERGKLVVPEQSLMRGRWPSSPAYLCQALRRPTSARPGRLVAALLPEGSTGNDHLGRMFDGYFGQAWPARPLFIPAVHLDSGARVVFGRAGAPRVDVGTAVRCSSAVPGLRRPILVDGDRFVDGGIASSAHTDLANDAELVIVSSPLSRVPLLRTLLRAELKRSTSRVVVFEPDRSTREKMGWRFLDARRAPAVAEAAYRGARQALEGPLSAVLAGALPATARRAAATSGASSR